MIGVVRFVVGLALAVLLHAVGTLAAPGFPAVCDLFLITTVVAARHGSIERSLIGGSVAGWAADALSGAPFGLFGFVNAAAGLLAALLSRRLVIDRIGSLIGLFAAAGAAQGILLGLLGLFVVPGIELPAPLTLLARAVLVALLGPFWIRLVDSAGVRWQRWRKRPGGLGFSKSLRS